MSKDNTVFIGKTKNFWDRNRRSNGYLLKRRIGQIAVSVIRALLMFGLCFMIIQPMITRFGMSLMKEKDLYDSTIVLLPRHVTLDNYRIVAELTDFPNSMINTLCQLSGIRAVRFYVEGSPADTLAGSVYLKSVLLPNPGIVASPADTAPPSQ